MAKAFDTVDHSILCTKLFGFRGSSYDLFSDYLSGRQQRVICFMATCSTGVLVYLRDQFYILMNCSPLSNTACILDLYADDAELHCSHSDLHMVETFLQSDLNSVSTWLLSSHLCLNVDKSNCVHAHWKFSEKGK